MENKETNNGDGNGGMFFWGLLMLVSVVVLWEAALDTMHLGLWLLSGFWTLAVIIIVCAMVKAYMEDLEKRKPKVDIQPTEAEIARINKQLKR